MAWSTPPTFTVGQILTAAQQNTLSGDLTFVYPATCRVRQSSGTSIPDTATFTLLGFDTEDWDTDTLHDNVTNNSRITIPSTTLAGKWRIYAQVATGSPAEAGYVAARIRKNGTTYIAGNSSQDWTTGVNVAIVDSAASGDYYEVLAAISHSPGSGALTTQAPTYFGASRFAG